MEHTCCFFGHRTAEETDELIAMIYAAVEDLILNAHVDTFLFGSKSRFDVLAHRTVTRIKEKYPHIKRIYVRAEFPVIGKEYESYLLKSYEETCYPEKLLGAGRAAYVERNREMIDRSLYCIVYYHSVHLPPDRKSGTKIALDYAIGKNRKVLTVG